MAATTAGRTGSSAAGLAFIRFVVCGGGVTLLGSGALLLAGHRIPLAAANAFVTVVTTVLATELHGRFTFRQGRASWSDHCASGLTVVVSYLFTTGALLGLREVHPSAGALLRQGVYLSASALAGIGRFLLLRLVIFASSAGSAAASGSASASATVGAGSAAKVSTGPKAVANAGSGKSAAALKGAQGLARGSVTVAA